MIKEANEKYNKVMTTDFTGCQLQCVPKFATSAARLPTISLIHSIKRSLAYPWNNYVKKWLKKIYYAYVRLSGTSSARESAKLYAPTVPFKKGDLVLIRSKEEILSTLDPFNELKGCSFLPEMFQYCGSEQHIFRVMEHFMDERDYKLKKTRGIILLENVFCNGTPVFGTCDRCCFLFWREEWLKKVC